MKIKNENKLRELFEDIMDQLNRSMDINFKVAELDDDIIRQWKAQYELDHYDNWETFDNILKDDKK